MLELVHLCPILSSSGKACFLLLELVLILVELISLVLELSSSSFSSGRTKFLLAELSFYWPSLFLVLDPLLCSGAVVKLVDHTTDLRVEAIAKSH